MAVLHIPFHRLFKQKARLPALIQAVESAYPPLAYTAELCGIHYTSQVKYKYSSVGIMCEDGCKFFLVNQSFYSCNDFVFVDVC